MDAPFHISELQLEHPDNVGSAEYRAIYELLENAESLGQVFSILSEFETWCQSIHKHIVG